MEILNTLLIHGMISALGGYIMYVVVLVTVSNKEEADKIAKALIQKKVAACVNIIPEINSIFWWQGKADSASELLLLIKSKRSKLASIIKLVKSLHSYTVPEIIALPIIAGEKQYLKWIDESLAFKKLKANAKKGAG